MKLFKLILSSALAGVCISIGGTVFLALDNKIIGALFFTVGLFTICTMGFSLYTGKVCYVFSENRRFAGTIPIIWLGNLLGTFIFARLLHLTRLSYLSEKAEFLCGTKLSDSPLSIFILAIFCNIMIYIAVDGFKNINNAAGKYLALFFGVMVFILCGFEHCVANMFYFSMADAWSIKTLLYLIIMTLGNAVGGVAIPLLRRAICAQED